VRFARAGEAFIVFDARHARVSRFSEPAPPARAKRLQWKSAFILREPSGGRHTVITRWLNDNHLTLNY
jgi:hypothetical protein